jgi:phospholipase C
MSRFAGARTVAAFAATILVTACGGQRGSAPTDPAVIPPAGGQRAVGSVEGVRSAASSKIAHVVFIVQENRSFDNLFQGYPGADTVPKGKNSLGQTIRLTPTSLGMQYVIDHSLDSFKAAYDNGKMDGFDKEQSFGGPINPQYVYVPHSESKPYFDLAKEFVLADRMFTSHLDESFVSHQYVIAGQAHSAVNLPSFYWGCDGGPSDMVQTITKQRTYGKPEVACYDYQTIADEIDMKHLTWRFYTSVLNADGGEWSGYQAVRHIRYGPDWAKDVITPQTRFLTDVQAGTLANVTWITPVCANSDHVNCGGKTGPHWVATLVNAIGASKFWDTSAVFVMWDEWGGLYDHVPPPYVDYDGLGMRVPLLIISPYAKKRYVSHVQYEHGSVLRFIEDQFGLGRLAASDTRANSPAADCFDFTQAPRKYVPVKTTYSRQYFMNQPYDGRPPDEQ